MILECSTWLTWTHRTEHNNIPVSFVNFFLLFLVVAGGAICYECNSKTDSCAPESLSGAREGSCSRGNDYCAVYKKEPPGNISFHQYTRYCASECKRYNTTYSTGKYEITKHCILCCKGDLCNNYTIDPCNPPSTAGRMRYEILTIVLLGVMAAVFNYFL